MALTSLIEDIADYLVTKDIGLYKGENLFLGDWMERPEFATVIRDTGSVSVTDQVLDRDVNGDISSHFRDQTIQIMTRASRYPEAWQQQQKVFLVLHGKAKVTIGNYLIQACRSLASPAVVSGSADEPWILSTNYALLARDDSAL